MIYQRETILKNGERCILRNGTEQDGEAVLEVFNITHGAVSYTHLTLPTSDLV